MKLETYTTAELLAMPPPEWIIEDVIAEKSTTMIYGPWGLGKSFMVLDMVLTATTGDDWLGERRVIRPLKTLYVVAEGVAWWPRRLRAHMLAKKEFNPENVLWVPEPVNLWAPPGGVDTSDIKALEETLADFQPDMVVFDTWVRCTAAFGMNEDKATDTAQVFRQLDRLRDEYNVAPIIVHHPTKMGNFRGSGNQGASLERIIELKEVKDHPELVDVYDEKGNHTQPFTPFRLRFEQVDIGDDETSAVLRYDGLVAAVGEGVPNYQAIAAACSVFGEKEFTFADISRVSPVKEGSMSQAIKQAVSKGFLKKLKDGGYLNALP